MNAMPFAAEARSPFTKSRHAATNSASSESFLHVPSASSQSTCPVHTHSAAYSTVSYGLTFSTNSLFRRCRYQSSSTDVASNPRQNNTEERTRKTNGLILAGNAICGMASSAPKNIAKRTDSSQTASTTSQLSLGMA